tara:strand:+ start:129 stop:992 length:864 start_codon:yes stop_codon:yes gene_type:complete
MADRKNRRLYRSGMEPVPGKRSMTAEELVEMYAAVPSLPDGPLDGYYSRYVDPEVLGRAPAPAPAPRRFTLPAQPARSMPAEPKRPVMYYSPKMGRNVPAEQIYNEARDADRSIIELMLQGAPVYSYYDLGSEDEPLMPGATRVVLNKPVPPLPFDPGFDRSLYDSTAATSAIDFKYSLADLDHLRGSSIEEKNVPPFSSPFYYDRVKMIMEELPKGYYGSAQHLADEKRREATGEVTPNLHLARMAGMLMRESDIEPSMAEYRDVTRNVFFDPEIYVGPPTQSDLP